MRMQFGYRTLKKCRSFEIALSILNRFGRNAVIFYECLDPLKCLLNWFSVKYAKKMKTYQNERQKTTIIYIFHVYWICVHKLWCKCPSLELAMRRRREETQVWCSVCKVYNLFCVSYVRSAHVRESEEKVCEPEKKEKERPSAGRKWE